MQIFFLLFLVFQKENDKLTNKRLEIPTPETTSVFFIKNEEELKQKKCRKLFFSNFFTVSDFILKCLWCNFECACAICGKNVIEEL